MYLNFPEASSKRLIEDDSEVSIRPIDNIEIEFDEETIQSRRFE